MRGEQRLELGFQEWIYNVSVNRVIATQTPTNIFPTLSYYVIKITFFKVN